MHKHEEHSSPSKNKKDEIDKKDKKHDEKEKAKLSGIITLDEYRFPHAIYMLEGSRLKDDDLINGYSKLHTYLNLEDHPGKSYFL